MYLAKKIIIMPHNFYNVCNNGLGRFCGAAGEEEALSKRLCSTRRPSLARSVEFSMQ